MYLLLLVTYITKRLSPVLVLFEVVTTAVFGLWIYLCIYTHIRGCVCVCVSPIVKFFFPYIAINRVLYLEGGSLPTSSCRDTPVSVFRDGWSVPISGDLLGRDGCRTRDYRSDGWFLSPEPSSSGRGGARDYRSEVSPLSYLRTTTSTGPTS